ncbi:MAG: RusA family crossover junction endodeoxyribonuclease [Candidatus Rokuibacteriota bacterium]
MKPDLDKLVRAVLDACTALAFVDDGQVVALNAGKEYGNAAGLDLSWSVIA